jgi:mutual gliding-motility protein MglA
MVSINYAFKEIISKIVYYGPGLSGKTTNLQYVFKKVPSETRGELISLATDADRTLYFDFLPVNVGNIQGFATKFQLYTVPGQVYYNATRKLVLRGVDGLVFVADSQVAKMDENIESLQNLSDNLEEYGYDITQLPLVLQYNKRDLPEIASIAELEHALNPRGVPYFEAVASTGDGVFKTLKAISKMVLDQVRAKRMEPARIITPQPVEAPVVVAAQTRPSPIIERPVKQSVAEITPAVELSAEPINTFDKIGTRKVERVVIGENDIPANVVVSDAPVEKKSYHEPEAEKDDFEETTERAVFKTEPLENENKNHIVPDEIKLTNDYCEVEQKPHSDTAEHYYNQSYGEETVIRDDEMPEFNMNSSMPLAKPQMAESRKVKNKKSKFNIMGWFKKSKN